MKRGIATLMMVFVVSLISIFIIGAWQSRLLLSIQRNQSLSDLLIVGYRAESEIYDWVAKFLGVYSNIYPVPLDGTACNLVDQSAPNQLCVTGNKIGNTESLDIKASRPYSATNLLLSREINSITGPGKVEIMLALDCTGSMDSAADPDDPSEGTRFDALEEATVALLDELDGISSPVFSVGLALFKVDSKLVTPPTTNISALKTQVQNGFNTNLANSPICNNLIDDTSVGSGMDEANKYFKTNPADADTKRFIVLMTDGDTNSTPSDSSCNVDHQLCIFYTQSQCNPPGTYQCSGGRGYVCIAKSQNYLTCKLASSDQLAGGQRDPEIDVFAVTVLKGLNQENREIYENYATKYYSSDKAADLPVIFSEIVVDIGETLQKIMIQRLVPTPQP